MVPTPPAPPAVTVSLGDVEEKDTDGDDVIDAISCSVTVENDTCVVTAVDQNDTDLDVVYVGGIATVDISGCITDDVITIKATAVTDTSKSDTKTYIVQ